MIEYDGTTSRQKALEQLHGKKLSNNENARITDKYRERLNVPKGKPITSPNDNVKIYQWERDELAAQTKPTELNIIQSDSDNGQLTTSELDLTHVVNDIELATKSTIELDLTQNDSRDKFISINYRRANNSRHTVQIEQFYIDALIAIGITDISKFVAENAGLTTVTKNVKRAIVDTLVKRAISQ